MAWRIVFIGVVWLASYSDGEKLFPKPSLTQHRSRVLKLECQPPEDTTSWQDVYDIRVFVCLRAPHFDTCVNHTVANITSAMKKPRRGSVLPSIAKVTFSGSWMPAGSPTLTVETPFSSQNYGVYYCAAEYDSSEGIRKYSAGLSVDDSSDTRRSPLKRDRFEVQIFKAHAVNVTWRPPDDSEFLEGRVTRSFVDREGKVTTAPRSLFMATATNKDVVFDKAGVLLTQFQPPSSTGPNYTMSVYVDSQKCTPFCRYSCSVPYHACWGEDAHFCECIHGENVVSTTASIESSEKSVTATTEPVYYSVASSTGLCAGDIAAIFLAVFIIACFVAVIVLIFLLRRGKLQDFRNWLGGLVRAKERKKETNCGEKKGKEQTKKDIGATNQQYTEAHAKPEQESLIVDIPPEEDRPQSSKRKYQQNGQPDSAGGAEAPEPPEEDRLQSSKRKYQQNGQPDSAGGAEAPDTRVENEEDLADLERIASVRGPEIQPTSLGTLDRSDGPEGPVDEGTSRLSKQNAGHRPSSGQGSVAIPAPTSTPSPQPGSAAVVQATVHESPSADRNQAGRPTLALGGNEDQPQPDHENVDYSINSQSNVNLRKNLKTTSESASVPLLEKDRQ
ncbi:uncharacterized protein [Littorina saxatilis]|uniref:uncharacterized protein n=1 Tax=Littorina saxatilis TaxID=31220 RepID=UPI0038B4F897